LSAASALIIGGLVSGAHDAQAKDASFSEAQKAELEDFVRDFIMNNPEVLIESVNQMREKEQQEQEANAKKALDDHAEFLLKDKSVPEIGNPEGDVTIIEFFDFNCGYCKRAFDVVSETVEKDKNVRVRFIDLPILSVSSEMASKWALAAKKQGKYWEFHSILMKNPAPKDEENMTNMANEVGMDVEKLKKDAESEDVKKELENARKVANALSITGTPGFIIGDEIIRGYAEYEAFKAMIEDQRKKNK